MSHDAPTISRPLVLVPAALLAVAYVGSIWAANAITNAYGLVPVGFGLTATAGTYLAGLALCLRDAVREVAGPVAALACIALGVALSALVSPGLAVASAFAFGLSELADHLVYERFRRTGRTRALAASNAVGMVLDTLVFLWLASLTVPFISFNGPTIAGQLVGKAWVTAAALAALYGAARTRRRPACSTS